MQTHPYNIEIDAQAAFQKIGVSLDQSPIGAPCVEALEERLIKLITAELLLQSMMAAAKRTKSKRGQHKPEPAAETKPGGTTELQAVSPQGISGEEVPR